MMAIETTKKTTTIALLLAMVTPLLAATPSAFAQVAAPEPEICPGQPWFVLCPANIADASINDPDAQTTSAEISAGDESNIINTQVQSDDDTNTIAQDQTQTPTQTLTDNILSVLSTFSGQLE